MSFLNRVALGRAGGELSNFDFNGLNVANHVGAAMSISFGGLAPAKGISCPGHNCAVARRGRSAPVELP